MEPKTTHVHATARGEAEDTMKIIDRIFRRVDSLAHDTRVTASETTKTVERIQEKRERLHENPNFPFSGFPTHAHPRKRPRVIPHHD